MSSLFNSIKYSFILCRKGFYQPRLCRPRLFQTSVGLAALRSRDRAPILRELKRRADYMKEKGIWPQTIRSQFLDWNYDAEVYAFGKRLGEDFDLSILKEAFVEHSYIVQEKERLKSLGMEDSLTLKSNESLAASGKLIAKDFILRYLRGCWPLLPEEGIECVTEYLISDELLGKIGKGVGLKDLILTKDYPPTENAFANSFLAVIACLQLSSGIERTFKFLQDLVIPQLVDKDIWDIWKIDDPLHMLKGILNANGRGDPEPRLIGDIGKLTIEATFYVGIYSDKVFFGAGYGETTDIAIHLAALDSLSRLFGQSSTKDPLPMFEDVSNFNLKTVPNPSLAELKIQSVR